MTEPSAAEFARFVLEAKEQRARADKAEAERDAAVAALNDQLAAVQAAIDRAKDFPCPECGHHLTVASLQE
jgi:DNA-directed RNA polymerase subunit M/transcription elongation factor TFIIS